MSETGLLRVRERVSASSRVDWYTKENKGNEVGPELASKELEFLEAVDELEVQLGVGKKYALTNEELLWMYQRIVRRDLSVSKTTWGWKVDMVDGREEKLGNLLSVEAKARSDRKFFGSVGHSRVGDYQTACNYFVPGLDYQDEGLRKYLGAIDDHETKFGKKDVPTWFLEDNFYKLVGDHWES